MDLQTWAQCFLGIGAITASLIGGLIVQYSKSRYSFLAWAVVSVFCFMSAYKMTPLVDQTVEGEDDDDSPKDFVGRCKYDYQIVKDNIK